MQREEIVTVVVTVVVHCTEIARVNVTVFDVYRGLLTNTLLNAPLAFDDNTRFAPAEGSGRLWGTRPTEGLSAQTHRGVPMVTGGTGGVR